MSSAQALSQNARLEALLESQLSDDTRTVEIDGLTGALSAEATIEALRISDPVGVWLVLEDARLDWNRAALLRGELDVSALAAAKLRIERTPVTEPSVLNAQASGVRIPELPISIRVDRFAIDEIVLGEALLGEAVTATVAAQAVLDDGGLQLELEASRLDTQRGEILLDVSFTRADERLSVTTRIDEPEGGVVATAIGLPGSPSVSLDIAGSGPLDAFDADLTLATDGQNRITGGVSLNGTGAGGVRRFRADLVGDIRPLLVSKAHAFFGPEMRVQLQGVQTREGVLDLTNLQMNAAQILV